MKKVFEDFDEIISKLEYPEYHYRKGNIVPVKDSIFDDCVKHIKLFFINNQSS